jgi:hypothetical protein
MKEACWYESIYVVQQPTQRGGYKGSDVKLYIDYKNQKRIEGTKLYAQNSNELEEAIKQAYEYSYKRFILKE